MRFLIFLLTFFISSLVRAQDYSNIVELINIKDSNSYLIVKDTTLFTQKWDTLAQPSFWQKVVNTTPDSCFMNIAATRKILFTLSFEEWNKQTDEEKDLYKDSIRKLYGLDTTVNLYVTSGKNHFYKVKKVIPSISKAIEIYKEQGVDPFYAQAILLIESPNKIQYSNVGAYGPFQLMKSVARTYGLKVNRRVDERKDFTKSAIASSKLLSVSCIPQAKRILGKHKINYNENELWFKLFVLHIYHAGAANVEGLLDETIKPKKGGKELITKMWQSEWGNFKNASQNYSQVALATLIILNRIALTDYDYLYDCKSEECIEI